MTEVAKHQVEMTKEQIEVLVKASIIPQGTPASQIALFARVCEEKQMSPFSKQIYLIKRGSKYTIQTSIDGYRTIAERSGCYAGNDEYTFDSGASEYDLLKSNKKRPTTAKATVYKIVSGQRVPFSAEASWDSYALDTPTWKKYPFLMLGKCAEALALRKAFPESFSGIHGDEEMEGAPIEDQKPKTRTERKQTTFKREEEIPVDYTDMLDTAKTVEDLAKIYNDNPAFHKDKNFTEALGQKKKELMSKTKKDEGKDNA